MKTTFDLPPELVRAVKLRAVHEGRKLKDVTAELLKRGLAAPEPPEKPRDAKPLIEIQSNGLPVVYGATNAPAKVMSTEALLALERDSLGEEDLQRAGHAL